MTGVSRFDFYPSDFLNGVIGLTGDEIAAYTVIMMLQYDRGGVVIYEGREREISVRCGLPRGRLAAAIAKLIDLGKLTLRDGALFNDRTSKELAKISERIRKNGENSASGGEATRQKWEQKRNDIIENEGQPASQPASRNKALLSPPSSSPPIEETASAVYSAPSAPPKPLTPRSELTLAVGDDLAAELVDFRKRMRKPLTPQAAARLAKQFLDTGAPQDAARMMIDRAWQGFNAEWFENARGPQARAGPANGSPSLFSKPGTDPYGPERSASAASKRQLEAIQRGEDPFDAIKRRYMPDKPGGSDISGEPVVRLLPPVGRG